MSADETDGPFPGLAEWDLLIISDSSNWGVGESYARLIEADRHVKVTLHDCWMGGNSVRNQLDLLRSNADVVPYLPSHTCTGAWQDLVREAEVIVVFGNPEDSRPPDGAWDGPDSHTAFPAGTYRDCTGDAEALAAYRAAISRSCAPETFARFKADLGALYDTIFELRGGRPVIMRSTDFYVPIYADVRKVGLEDCCRVCIETFAAAIHETAREHGVPVGSSFDALNGPDHRSDPRERGYIAPDGIHLSSRGAQRVAEALHATGYGYART